MFITSIHLKNTIIPLEAPYRQKVESTFSQLKHHFASHERVFRGGRISIKSNEVRFYRGGLLTNKEKIKQIVDFFENLAKVIEENPIYK